MKNRNIIHISSRTPPVVEFDMEALAWYVRFSRRKIVKTISQDKPGAIVAIDLDDRGEVVGVELLGIREFSIRAFVKLTGIKAAGIDFSKTRFVPAGLADVESQAA